jgi:hypothetical protein
MPMFASRGAYVGKPLHVAYGDQSEAYRTGTESRAHDRAFSTSTEAAARAAETEKAPR